MDDRRTDDGVTGILIAHLGAFGSGELKKQSHKSVMTSRNYEMTSRKYNITS